MIAFDVCGVQPMTMPTGLIFALRSRYVRNGAKAEEALYREADTAFAGDTGGVTDPTDPNYRHKGSNWADGSAFSTGTGMSTAMAEAAGSDASNPMAEMAFSIERTSVVAKSRALKAEYTMELAQDLKAVHGLDAENELSNILSTEVLAEINREVIRDIYMIAKPGCVSGTAQQGVFDLDIDSDGRWSAEKYKSLMMRIEREANAIAQDTRRGRGNFIICSSDVASALNMAGMLDYTPALNNNLNVDEANATFAGILNGKYKCYVDPYMANQSDTQYFVMGYKGNTAYDAGMFYCPYVPLQLVRAQDPNTFQPKIGFKTRYGITFNPMTVLDAKIEDYEGGNVTVEALRNKNYFYRKVIIKNL
jgi:hypothetical protein